MSGKTEKNWFERLGCQVSEWVADIAGHPFAQIGVILICAFWFLGGFATDLLTAILSILAITLSQMVLNNQAQREIDIHRRDVAMHAKLDELIAVSRRAKNEFIGIEEREEDEIVQLKEEVKDAIEESTEARTPEERRHALEEAERAKDELEDAEEKSASPRKARP
ncbi:low affinity iron permease family protein [Sphingomonas lutea]|nr:low affinity iron permease family protein [Sphingomonas lutea]